MKRWFAVYTRPRWEKKVFRLLEEHGIEGYCPINKVQKKWSDRIKLVEEPLFKSYVFVRVEEKDMTSVRFVDGILNYVYWQGKPAVIKEEEIERIKRFMTEHEHVSVVNTDIAPGSSVQITSGVLMDRMGKVQGTRNKQVEILIESLGCKLVAWVDWDKIVVKN